MTMHRCMVQDTVLATSLLNLGMYAIDQMPEKAGEYFWSMRMFFRIVDMIGMLNAFQEIAYSINVSIYKVDVFVLGQLLGKIIKLVTQLELIRITSTQSYLYDHSYDRADNED